MTTDITEMQKILIDQIARLEKDIADASLNNRDQMIIDALLLRLINRQRNLEYLESVNENHSQLLQG